MDALCEHSTICRSNYPGLRVFIRKVPLWMKYVRSLNGKIFGYKFSLFHSDNLGEKSSIHSDSTLQLHGTLTIAGKGAIN